jgi:hypothetical protein
VIWFAFLPICYIVCLAGFTSQTPANVNVDVTTQRYDNARTGGNYSEKILNTSNVSPARFGKLFTRTVDDDVYAQPLYLHNVFLPNPAIEGLRLPAGSERVLDSIHLGRFRNVLYVATVSNSVYAFDADDPAATTPLWHVNLTGVSLGAGPVKNSDVGQNCTLAVGSYPDFSGDIGIVGTPVIDAVSHTVYVVARTKENGEFVQRLHALDAATGAERTHSPVVIGSTGARGWRGLVERCARLRCRNSKPAGSAPVGEWHCLHHLGWTL